MPSASPWLRRLTRPVVVWSVAALVLELGYQWVLRHRRHVPWFAGLLPILPMIMYVVSLMRTIRGMDELQKRICQESIYFAFVATLAYTLLLAGVDRMGWYRAGWDDVGEFMLLSWGCAYIFVARKYR